MSQISAFVICKNEEKNIAKALESLAGCVDEIVVVDGFSTDKTFEIAQKYSDRVIQREWTNFGEQRNFALNLTRFEWVFFLDADEICSDELKRWLINFRRLGPEKVEDTVSRSSSVHPLKNPQRRQVDLYEIRRWEHFKGQLYKYGANNPSHQWRFFRRDQAIFKGDVHEYIVVPGEIRRLELPILHFPKANLEEVITKMNRYSSLEAEQMFRKGVIKGPTYMFFSGLAMFLKAYFRKQGFRDGTIGFILAVIDGSGFFLRQAKLYLRNRTAGRI